MSVNDKPQIELPSQERKLNINLVPRKENWPLNWFCLPSVYKGHVGWHFGAVMELF